MSHITKTAEDLFEVYKHIFAECGKYWADDFEFIAINEFDADQLRQAANFSDVFTLFGNKNTARLLSDNPQFTAREITALISLNTDIVRMVQVAEEDDGFPVNAAIAFLETSEGLVSRHAQVHA